MKHKKFYAFCLLLMASCLPLLAQSTMKAKIYQDCSKNGQKIDVQTAPTGLPQNVQIVDLGLSVKWANMNVGATKPEEYGNYYAWGEVTPKENYDWSTYKWCNGSETTMTKYCTQKAYDTVDNKTVLEKADDAASYNWGGDWRMPTIEEINELKTQCSGQWTTNYNGTGVKGYIVTGPNGNSIFLPAAGFRYGSGLDDAGEFGRYWSSSLRGYDSVYAYSLDFGEFYYDWGGSYRYDGRSVRPVLK